MTPTGSRTLVVCGVDVGSTSTKAVAIDGRGEVVARSSRPTQRDPGDISIDADELVDAIEDVILELCTSSAG